VAPGCLDDLIELCAGEDLIGREPAGDDLPQLRGDRCRVGLLLCGELQDRTVPLSEEGDQRLRLAPTAV